MPSACNLPTGVVTFLLTDIEGSTRLWEREPQAMRQALARHDAIVGTCVGRLQGHLVKSKGEGDSTFAVFRHVRDAVSAALVIQCALRAERWPTSTPIRVRMAVHTGQIELRDGDYYGPTVNRCARLRALAKGGQVLLSGVTAKLSQAQLPDGASLKDMGTHQLKDLSAPERVWQLAHPRMELETTTAPAQPQAAKAAPAPLLPLAYKLTDHLNRSADGVEWASGVTYRGDALGESGEDNRIRCYTSPLLAALMNPLYERFRLPHLWEAKVDVEWEPHEAIVAGRTVTTLRQVPLPTLSGEHHARFAVLCARAAYKEGKYAQEFGAWAEGWLEGHDRSGIEARALAEELAAQAARGFGLAQPEELMVANAASAAMYASRLSWLAGRARDEESARAAEAATEAVGTALRLGQLDLPALAAEAVPSAAGAAGGPPMRVGVA